MLLIPVECLLSSSTNDSYHSPTLYTIFPTPRPLAPLAFSTALIRSFLSVVIYEIYGQSFFVDFLDSFFKAFSNFLAFLSFLASLSFLAFLESLSFLLFLDSLSFLDFLDSFTSSNSFLDCLSFLSFFFIFVFLFLIFFILFT